jgi:hypothetical protein
MNKATITLLFLITGLLVEACPMCEKQQPKLLRGITHGAGPSSNWDYIITWAMVAIVLFTLAYSIKCLVRPGEKSPGHIKRQILDNQ